MYLLTQAKSLSFTGFLTLRVYKCQITEFCKNPAHNIVTQCLWQWNSDYFPTGTQILQLKWLHQSICFLHMTCQAKKKVTNPLSKYSALLLHEILPDREKYLARYYSVHKSQLQIWCFRCCKKQIGYTFLKFKIVLLKLHILSISIG